MGVHRSVAYRILRGDGGSNALRVRAVATVCGTRARQTHVRLLVNDITGQGDEDRTPRRVLRDLTEVIDRTFPVNAPLDRENAGEKPAKPALGGAGALDHSPGERSQTVTPPTVFGVKLLVSHAVIVL